MTISSQSRAAALFSKLHTITTVNKTPQFALTSGGNLYQVEIDNTGNTSALYVKLYDAASSITYATDDVSHVYYAPASMTITYSFPEGVTFAAGIGVVAASAGGTGSGSDSAPTSALTVYLHTS